MTADCRFGLRLSALAAVAIVATAPVASAAERFELAVPGGLAALEREQGIESGISQPPGKVIAVRPDGKRFEVTLGGETLALLPTDRHLVVAPAPDMLPDGQIAEGKGAIRRAWLTGPTGRYAHGILGDAIEASGVGIERADGEFLYFELGDDSVFEDRRARLYDLDGDGADEVIVVQSFLNAGAALTVLEAEGDSLTLAAAAEPIGRSNRWLNPAGAADFDGDGRAEVAYVETPHIGGTLRLYEYRDGRLREDAAARGFSNHAIGSREQGQAATVDWNGDGVDDLLVPDARRRHLRVVTFAGGVFEELERIENTQPIVTAILPAPLGAAGRISVIYGLADGTLVAVSPAGGD